MTTTTIDQLLIEATEAMNALTIAVVQRSDPAQATLATKAAQDALDRLNAVIALESAAKASKEAAQLAASGAAASKTAAEDAKTASEAAKNTAVGAANAAALSQSAAASSATTAGEKASEATAKALEAAQSAASAGQSAIAAASKAQESATNAAQVAADKTAAKASADAALASQQTAEQKAAAADTSAQAAQASALTAGQKEQQSKANADAAADSAQTAATKAAETVTNAGAAAQSKAAANLSEVAAAAAAAAAASSAQAATAGGIRYDTQQALTEAGKAQAKANIGLTEMLGAASGIATLDVAGKVPAAQLPSYVDDVQDFANFAALPATGEKSKIYVLDTPHKLGNVTSSQFRWSGTAYAPIIASPGSTDSVTEGATNLYFTPERAQAAVQSVPGNAGTATSLLGGGTIQYNISGVQWFNLSGVGGTGLSGSAPGNPSNDWYHHLTLNHQNPGGYYVDIAACFHSDDILFRRLVGGSLTTWRKLIHDANFNTYAPTLTGGGASGNWGINITGNAGTVGGLAVHTARNNEANKVVRTDVNGYIQAGWINTDSGDNGRTGIARIYASQDSYLRYYTPGNFIAALNSSAYSREVNGGTLVPGTRYSIYTGSGAISMSLPTSGAQGDEIEISNLLQTWAGNAFTVTCPSNCRINNLLESLVCNHNAGGFTMVLTYFDGSTYFWTVRT